MLFTRHHYSRLLSKLYHRPITYTQDPSPLEAAKTSTPTFQVLDVQGTLISKSLEPQLSKEQCRKMLKDMITLTIMDDILYNAQRQGRISFYMTSTGEEATHIGSAAALEPSDYIYGQYREAGVLLYRGFRLEQFMNQCFGNAKDPGKGKQMPVHYGSVEHNFFTISSPLGTQIPQAAGTAYGLKLDGKQNVVICYFGEGAASEGDFHAGLNIAATTECPVIFYCRNNGYAISTPAKEQYRGDGIVTRATGYGIPAFRVDGNDILANYLITQSARKIALERNTPVLVEAITYRVGHHSTSDDSSAYRSKEEVREWVQNNEPISRFRKYLIDKKWWDVKEEEEERKKIREQVIDAMKAAEQEKKPPVSDMFDDIYEELPLRLREQKTELKELLDSRPQDFPTLNQHLPWRD